MKTCLVTGAAGFVGSHLCEALLAAGHRVIGIDAFIPYYPRALKEKNLANLTKIPNFSFYELDLRTDILQPTLTEADVVFHMAAMPGLLRSWSEFESYMTCNILATERLLEVAMRVKTNHFIYGSTSSVYGQVAKGDEDSSLLPVSPYGITKLAAENLCQAYATNYQLPITILRFFSIYGPRQRPDMGYNIFIRAMLNDETITIQGDGNDSRSNTYIGDCIDGILLAFEQPEKSIGKTFNIGGGEEISVNQVIHLLEDILGKKANTIYGPARPGDQKQTAADIHKANTLLGYLPTVTIEQGLRYQVEWQRNSFKESCLRN